MAPSTPPGQSAGLQHVGRRLRRAPWFGPTVAGIAGGATAALSAIAMPRGPATTAQALVVMATGAVIGIVAGLAWPRRRAMVLAAVTYVVCYELARPAWAGPSVGAVRFDSMVAVVMLVAGWYDYLYKPYTPSAGYESRGASSGVGLYGMLGSEYTLVEKTNVLRGLADTFAVMYPQLYAVDFRRDVPSLDVPVYLLDGAAELEGRRDLAIEWFDQLVAPVKQRVTYQDAAHSVAFEQADEVQKLLVQTVVPATYGD